MSTTTASTYNGWTNYETWRVNLEMFDGYDATDELDGFDIRDREDQDDWRERAIQMLADTFEAMASDALDADIPRGSGLAYELACHFLNKVDWQEIAEHRVDDYLDTHNLPSDSDNRY